MENDSLNILISCASQSQMDPYVSCFRELGHNVRGHRVSSGQGLVQSLEDPQWDLVIAVENHPEVSPMQVLQTIRGKNLHIPCVVHMLGAEGSSDRDYLREGACDVITSLDDERLSLNGMRAIDAYRDRRELLELRVKYEETARRCELLLATSNDAIGYLVDGMHVDTNDAYAELFGYGDKDDLAAIPLVDLIAEQNQADFKAALKRYRSHPEDETSIDFMGVREDGAEFPAQLVLSTASFEGEPCMQALVRPQQVTLSAAPAATQATPTAAPITIASDASGMAVLQQLVDSSAGGQLLLFRIDDFAGHSSNLGVTGAAQLPGIIAEFLGQQHGWNSKPFQAADDVIAISLSEKDAEEALATARRCVEEVAGNIFEVGAQSARCALCVVVVELGGDTFDSGSALIDASWSTLLQLAQGSLSLRSQDAARAQLMVTSSAGAGTTGGVEVIETAIREGAVSLTFQPMISLRGDVSEYYEVRALYRDAENDAVQSADSWLESHHLADKTLPLDQFVIEESLRRLATHLPDHPQTRLVLPIGPGSLADPEFISWFNVQLQESGVSAEALVLQVAHRVARTWLKQAQQLGEKIRDLGANLSISEVDNANKPMDDLMHLKPQFVRIDEKLVSALENYEQTNTLLKPLVDALHHDQMSSIMPGVSAAGALAVLWQLGVAYIEGDYLQAPSPEMTYDFTDLA